MTARSDRGATAIFLALVLLLLLGVAAVALDLARGWNERRQDQTSVDIAAVAGALSFGTSANAIADEVMAAARANLDSTYSDAEWNASWTGCDGSSRPAGFIAAPSSIGTIQCIGLNPSFLWVRLPDQFVDASFGRVLGVDSLSTRADVIVTLIGDSGSGALPFAIRGNASSGQICLDTGPGGPTIEDPCENNEAGSFGNIAPPLFGNEALGTPQECQGQAAGDGYIAEAIAMGTDHVLWPMSLADWTATGWDPDANTGNNTVRSDPRTNLDECIESDGFVAEPKDGVPINTVYIDTGNQTAATAGLITGTNFFDGKHARLVPPRASTTRSITLKSTTYQVDNVPLWDHLLSGNTGACDPAAYDGLDIDEKTDLLGECVENYTGGQIFSDSILGTPRLGVAPRLWHNNLGSGLTFRPIQTFEVVYLHGLFIKGSSDVWFYPDDDDTVISVGGSPKVELVTGFLLSKSMVSDNVHETLGGFTNDTWQPEIWR